ncbi:hypothetical protein [Streptomonospora litoralis]|uniref:Uncharacterized protein n=1 Tax=Streptomonospora litoralis TaxID=2498135 RepID=A0A4P6PZB7_9ACTN|nr:hypothetical protein [Streptomonospora litoralis]QBI51849.1 hypothetical protein EKD16_00110 [Streptomonospora litoralis]
MLDALVGVLGEVSKALSSGDGLRLLIYGNTAVLLAINSIAGRSTARKRYEALRNKALTAGGPLTKQRHATERWGEHQRLRGELLKERVDARADRAKAAEQEARRAQNTERGGYGLVSAARNVADALKEADERRAKADAERPKLHVPETTRRTRSQGSTPSDPETRGRR